MTVSDAEHNHSFLTSSVRVDTDHRTEKVNDVLSLWGMSILKLFTLTRTSQSVAAFGAIQVLLRNPVGGGKVSAFLEKIINYEDVRMNVISVTRAWVGVKFPEKSVT